MFTFLAHRVSALRVLETATLVSDIVAIVSDWDIFMVPAMWADVNESLARGLSVR